MSSTSNYSPSLSCVPGRNVSLTNLKVCDSASVNGDLTVDGDLTVSTINGDPYLPVPPLVPNQVLKTTSGTPPISLVWGEVDPTNITNGGNLTTLRSRGGNAVWDPPNLDILPAGSNNQLLSSFSGGTINWRNFTVDLIPPGFNNQVITTVGGATTWATPSRPQLMRYGTNLLQQNFNAIAGPSFVTFSTSPFTVLTGGGVSPFSQPNTTDFVCGFTGTYDVFLNGYFNPSSAGIGNSVISLSAQVNGAELVRTLSLIHI